MTITSLFRHPALLLLLGFAACGSNTSGEAAADGEGASGPIYVGTTRIFSQDSSTGYMYRLHSLDGTDAVDLKDAVELSDDAWVFGDANPYFYTAAIFAPVITQWSLDTKGNFVMGGRVNFANEGISGTYGAAFVPLYSQQKSYFVDGSSGRLIIWNPQKMELIRGLDLDLSLPAGYPNADTLTPSAELTTTSDAVLVTVTWGSQTSGWTETASFSRLIVVDPHTDAVVSTSDRAGCESLSPAGTTSDGTTYFAPWDYKAAVRGIFGAGYGATSCGLRALPAGADFDASFTIDLSTLTGGKPAGSAFLEDDQHLLLHVWDNTLVGATSTNWIDDKRWEAGYLWYRWTIGEPEAVVVTGQTPTGEGGSWQKLDGRRVSYSPNADFSETTLIWLGSDGGMTNGTQIPGYSVAMIRAR